MKLSLFTRESKRFTDPCPSIEPLEARIAPAGAVLTAYDPITGVLTITGDGEANGVKILKTGPNAYRIEGVATPDPLGVADPSPTTIDGQAFRDIGKITSIGFDMGEGDDTVEMVDVKKLKTLDFKGGAGSDIFEASNLATSGAANFDLGEGEDLVKFTGIATVIGNNLTVTANEGGSRVEFLAESNSVLRAISLTGGDGDDGLFLGQDSILRVGRDITVLGGSGGNDYVDLDRGRIINLGKNADGLSLRFEGSGSDSDRVAVGGERVVFAGGVKIVGSSDTTTGDQFSFGSRTSASGAVSLTNDLRIGKDRAGISIRIDALEGDDTLSLDVSSGVLSGGVVYNAGDGDNEFRSTNSGKITVGKITKDDVVAGLYAGQSIAYTGGSGDDFIVLNAVNLSTAGFLGIDAGDGENQLSSIAANAIKIGRASAFGESLFYIGGSGEDSIILDSPVVSLAGYANVSTYEGDDYFFIHSENASFGTSENPYSIYFDSGMGDDTFALTSEEVIATGHLMMRSGFPSVGNVDDNDLFAVNCASFNGVGVTFSGSHGDDTFEMNVDRLALSVLNYQSGGGSDSIGINANGRVKDVEFNFGSSLVSPNPGQSQVNISRSNNESPGALIFGRPTPPAESRTDFSVRFLASGDNGFDALFQNVTFQNTLVINSGAGDNTVILDNIQAFGGLSLATGIGADVVEIERGLWPGPSMFKKLASINLGAGDDIVRIGSSTETPSDHHVRFLGGLELVGGEGTDSMNADLTAANEIVGTPVIEIEEQGA